MLRPPVSVRSALYDSPTNSWACCSKLLFLDSYAAEPHATALPFLQMSKSDPIEKALNRLGELRHEAPAERTAQEIQQFLTHRSNLVAAKAAKIVGEGRHSQLVPDLVSAFHRFMTNP